MDSTKMQAAGAMPKHRRKIAPPELLPGARAGEGAGHLRNSRSWPDRMLAVVMEIDEDRLRQVGEGRTVADIQVDIDRILASHGLDERRDWTWHPSDGNGKDVDAVACILAVQDIARSMPWLTGALREIRLLRIEEITDMMPAVEAERAAMVSRPEAGTVQGKLP